MRYLTLLIMMLWPILHSCSSGDEELNKKVFEGLEAEKSPQFRQPTAAKACTDGVWKLKEGRSDFAMRCMQGVWNNAPQNKGDPVNFIQCPASSLVVFSDDQRTAWCRSESFGIVASSAGDSSKCAPDWEGAWEIAGGPAKRSAWRCTQGMWGNSGVKGNDGGPNFMECGFGTSATFSADRHFAWCAAADGTLALAKAGNPARCPPTQEATWSVLYDSAGKSAVRCYLSIWNSAENSVDGLNNYMNCNRDTDAKIQTSQDGQRAWCENSLARIEEAGGHPSQCSAEEEGKWRLGSRAGSHNFAFRCNKGKWGNDKAHELFCPTNKKIEIADSGSPFCN